jgi:hypothetical protein
MARSAFISPDWQRRARAAVVEAASKELAAIQPASLLSASDIGVLADTIISAWIRFRAEQAVVNGVKHDSLVLTTGNIPEPWDVGTVAAILPELAAQEIDWSKPLAAWSRGVMSAFIYLACKAQSARDAAQAAVGAEFGDSIPF